MMTEIDVNLKNEREARGISLKQISQKTNISIKFLSALENGDFYLLPGDFYIKQYLRNYLEALAIDADEFFKNHRQWPEHHCPGDQNIPDKYIPKLRYSRFKRKKLTLTLFIFLLGVILAAGFFNLSKNKTVLQRFSFSKKIELPATAVSVAVEKKEFDLDRSPVNVRIDFLADCWTSTRRGNLERLEKTFKKGERLILRGYEFSLYIGKPAFVKFFLNEQEVTYLNKLNRPERIDINPRNLQRILDK